MISQDMRNLRRLMHEAAIEGRLDYVTLQQALGALDRLADQVEALETTLVPPTARAVADGARVVDLSKARQARRPAPPPGGSAA